MNKLQHILPSLALVCALSLIAFEAWQTGIVQVNPNTVVSCSANGSEKKAHGIEIRVLFNNTQITWINCNE